MASMLLLNDVQFKPQHGSIVREALRRVCARSATPVAAASSLRVVRDTLEERLSGSSSHAEKHVFLLLLLLD